MDNFKKGTYLPHYRLVICLADDYLKHLLRFPPEGLGLMMG